MVLIGSDWPEATRNALKRARDADSAGLANLNKVLDGKDHKAELPCIVGSSQQWVTDLSAEAWSSSHCSRRSRGFGKTQLGRGYLRVSVPALTMSVAPCAPRKHSQHSATRRERMSC